MGCGSSVSKDIGAPELKRTADAVNQKLAIVKYTSSVNGFTNAVIRKHILDLDSIELIYNDVENQEVDCPELFKNQDVSVLVKGLKGLAKDSNNKYAPKVSYVLTSLDSKLPVGKADDILSAEQHGIDEKEATNFKFKLNKLDELKKFEKYHLQVQIEDKKSNKFAHIFYDFKFTAKVSGEEGRKVHQRNPGQEHSEDLNNISVKTRGGIAYKKVSLSDGKKPYIAPYTIKYGNKVQMKIEGIKGYITNDDLGNIGFSILITDDQGKEVYFKNDLFEAENEYHVEELSEISTFIILGGESFNPETTYTWSSRLWDKLGDSQISITTQYKGDKEVDTLILPKEVKTDVPNKCEVKISGESGFLHERIGILWANKSLEQQFKDACSKESMLNAIWVYHPGAKPEEQNVLHFVEKDQKKATFWKLDKLSQSE